MNNQNLKVDKYLNLLITPDNNIRDFYFNTLKGRSKHTQISYLTNLKILFKETQKNNVQDITKDDFYKILNSEHGKEWLKENKQRSIERYKKKKDED